MSVGPLEIVLVLVIALLVFGPNRLPQAGRNLGRALREFKRATDSAKSELGLDEVIDEFKGVKDSIAGDFNSVKDGVSGELKSTGATQAMSAIKTGMSIDLKNPLSRAKTVIGGAAASGAAAAVDKPVQVAPATDEDDGWPQGVAAPPAPPSGATATPDGGETPASAATAGAEPAGAAAPVAGQDG